MTSGTSTSMRPEAAATPLDPKTRRSLAIGLAAAAAMLILAAVVPFSPAIAQDQAPEKSCEDERLWFEQYDDAPALRADVPELHSITLDLPFEAPLGQYEILISVFERDSRAGQGLEQLNVTVDGHTHGPTPDLPGEVNGVLDEMVDYSLGIVSVDNPIKTVTVTHAHAGEPGIGPESIRVEGVTLVCTPTPEPPAPTTSEPQVQGSTTIASSAPTTSEPQVLGSTSIKPTPTSEEVLALTGPSDTNRSFGYAGMSALSLGFGLLLLSIVVAAKKS